MLPFPPFLASCLPGTAMFSSPLVGVAPAPFSPLVVRFRFPHGRYVIWSFSTRVPCSQLQLLFFPLPLSCISVSFLIRKQLPLFPPGPFLLVKCPRMPPTLSYCLYSASFWRAGRQKQAPPPREEPIFLLAVSRVIPPTPPLQSLTIDFFFRRSMQIEKFRWLRASRFFSPNPAEAAFFFFPLPSGHYPFFPISRPNFRAVSRCANELGLFIHFFCRTCD